MSHNTDICTNCYEEVNGDRMAAMSDIDMWCNNCFVDFEFEEKK